MESGNITQKSAEVLKVNQIFIINLLSKTKHNPYKHYTDYVSFARVISSLIVGYGIWIYKRKEKPAELFLSRRINSLGGILAHH
jgi:hypoxanthine-guanine phosphoribosyltransferase